MEIQLSREQEIYPSKEILNFKNVLGKVYDVLEELETRLTQDELALTLDWRYYRDGKLWLCKVCHKKRTIFWLSAWEGFFKTSFFFTEKHLEGIAKLEILEQIKEEFYRTKSIGKLLPMIINIDNQEQLVDLFTIIKFKKAAK